MSVEWVHDLEFCELAGLYALSRCVAASSRASIVDPQASSCSGSEKQEEESELRVAQLQHQLPSNEPCALMNLVGDVTAEDEDDEDTRECKQLFKNMKFFLSREVRPVLCWNLKYNSSLEKERVD